MRERSTWSRKEIAKKAAEVAGDIYTMNQDHPQPAMDEYVIGDSSDFAEDVQSTNTWETEYSNGATKRNELGMPEMRSDTFNHAEKTASEKVRLKKAELCVAVAKMMLKGKKVAGAEAIEDQAVALMYMPDAELINTHKRLAAEQEQQQDQDDDDDDDVNDDDFDDADDIDDDGEEQQQATKRAGEIPPQFKENIEKMKAKSEDKDEEEEEGGKKQAAGTDDEAPASVQKKIEDAADTTDKDDQNDNKTASKSKKAKTIDTIKRAMGQQQQLIAQMQQLLQQAMDQQDQQEPPAPVAGLQGPALAQQQILPQDQQQLQVQDDLDQMFDDQLDPIAEDDIEIEPAGMDVDNVVLAGEDEILRSLFAQDQEQGDSDDDTQQQSKQAAVRTASTRTVGTRPTAGVSKLGGSVSKTAASSQVDNLSSLWSSAPDVRAAFGLK